MVDGETVKVIAGKVQYLKSEQHALSHVTTSSAPKLTPNPT